MANSLMELYGGGMTGPSSNYQLGGRIASSKRESEFQGEKREIEEKQKAAAKRKRKAGWLGTVGSFLGGTVGSVLGPWGTAAGAGIGRALGESSYAREDYGGGKYAQETRGDLREAEDDYRKGIGERALVTGIQAGIMPGVYDKAGKAIGTGMGKVGQAFREAQTSGELFGLGEGIKEFGRELGTQFGGKMPMEMLSAPSVLSSATGAIAPPLLDTASAVTSPSAGLGLDMPSFAQGPFAGNKAFGRTPVGFKDTFAQAAREGGLGSTFDWRGNPYVVEYSGRGGGLINYMIPQMQGGGRIGTEYDPTRPQQQQTNPYGQQMFGSNNPVFGPGTDWSMTGSNVLGFQGAGAQVSNPDAAPLTGRGINVGYGTATDVGGALSQMGMGNIMNDPRFAQYAGDLPQFGMGYSQQVGDIYAGGKQATRGIRGGARTAAGQRGFGRSGIGSQQLESSMTNLYTDIDRQRRGVVEGYQADLLSAIGDIERKGEFEFDRNALATAPPSLATPMNQNPNVALTPAEEQHQQEMQDYYDQQYG